MKKLVYIFLLSLIFNNLYSQIGVTNSKPKIIPQVSRLGLINNWTGINNNFRYVYANNYVTTNAGFAIGDSVNSYYLALKLPNSAIDVNTRYISNYTGTGTSQDGLHVGINNGGIVGNIGTRIYDGQSSNYMFINNSSLTTNGLTSFLFGDQSNDGTFAQFSGDTKFKSNLLVDGNIGVGITPTEKLHIKDGNILIEATSPQVLFKSGSSNIIPLRYSANKIYFGNGTGLSIDDFGGANTVHIQGNNGNVGIGIATPTSKLHVVQSSISSVSSGNGTANSNVINVLGGSGGSSSTTTGSISAGKGGGINMTAGVGGFVTGNPTSGFAGNGGDISFDAGIGGNSSGTTNYGGSGGYTNLSGGTGGIGTINSGNGGYVSLKGGNAAATGNSSGGNVYIVGGTANGTGTVGDVYLGMSPSSTIRGSVIIGANLNNGYKLDVNGTMRVIGATTLPTLTTIGSVSSTEIGYLSGVTSSIQTQISSKANSSQLSSKASTVSNDFTGINNFPLLGLTSQPNSNIFTPSTGLILFANSSNAFSWKGANGYFRTFDGTSNTTDRSYTLPNASGTFGLLESPQIWTGINSFTGANMMIGTTTNAGYKLDVVGTSRLDGNTISLTSSKVAVDNGASPWSLRLYTGGILSYGQTINIFAGSTGDGQSSGVNFGTTLASVFSTKASIFPNGNFLINTVTDAGYKLDVNGTLRVTGKISVSTGANTSVGNSTLVGGTITVSNTSVTANSQIFVTVSTSSGTRGFLSTAKVAGTSFTITSTSNTDTSAVDWWIIN